MSAAQPSTIIELNHLSLLAISGPDAEKFLQGQLTCDVREVTSQQSRLAAHCNPKGRIITSFRLLRLQDTFYLLLPQSMLEIATSNLQKYAIFSKVTISEATDTLAKIGLAGPTIDNILASYFPALPQTVDTMIEHNGVSLIRVDTLASRYLAIGKHEVLGSLQQNLLAQLPVSAEKTWDLLDIQAGIPSIYPETSGLLTPHQINYQLLNGVSFKKGCYTGQEVITRMQYLGKLKQHMYRAEIIATETPQPAAKICCQEDGNLQAVGEVVMAQAVDGNYQALICLQDRAANLELSLNENPLSQILLLDLPYRSST